LVTTPEMLALVAPWVTLDDGDDSDDPGEKLDDGGGDDPMDTS